MIRDGSRIIMLDAICDRCKKRADELLPYKFSEVKYRGKVIELPWLCKKCFEIEKEKAWRENRIYGIHIPLRDENDAI